MKLQCGHDQTDPRYTIYCEACWENLHRTARLDSHPRPRFPRHVRQTPEGRRLEQWREERLREDPHFRGD